MQRSFYCILLLLAGLFGVPAIIQSGPAVEDLGYKSDPRFTLLRDFFQKKNCPVEELTADFLAAADQHSLDWRLLPSISFVESGGGKQFMNNNIFGWDNCRQAFPTVREGIYFVAHRLANSKFYKEKDLEGKLRTYNPFPEYPGRVKLVMNALGPANLLPPTSPVN